MDLGLENRTCSGGCGKTFRVLPSSSQRTARSDCAHTCGKAPWTEPQLNRLKRGSLVAGAPEETPQEAERMAKAKVETDRMKAYAAAPSPVQKSNNIKQPVVQMKVVSTPELSPEPEPGAQSNPGDERMRLWLAAVDRAKRAVSDLHTARAVIVKLAREVCDIHWGGGDHWTEHEGVFTARRFAKEIGINYKTMMNWMRVWREIADETKPGEWKDEDFKYAQQAIKRCGAQSDRKKRLGEFRRLRDGQKSVFRLSIIIQWARSHRNFLKSANHKDLDPNDLLALRELASDTVRVIDERMKP